MTNKTLDQLTALPLPPLTSDLLPILRPSVGVLESITWGSLVSLLPLGGQIYGLTLSTAGASSIFSIAAGQATNSTNLVLMSLASAYTKTTGAWVAGSGNGALDTGAIANNTWYHVHLIQRSDNGLVDVLISTSATAPTLPTSYTSFRRIGAMKTDGSAHWTAFLQRGDDFYWANFVADVANVTPTSGATNTITLSVPPAIGAKAIVQAIVTWNGGVTTVLLVNDPAITSPVAQVFSLSGLTIQNVALYTNATAQITTILTYGTPAPYTINTVGWTDTRGRLA